MEQAFPVISEVKQQKSEQGQGYTLCTSQSLCTDHTAHTESRLRSRQNAGHFQCTIYTNAPRGRIHTQRQLISPTPWRWNLSLKLALPFPSHSGCSNQPHHRSSNLRPYKYCTDHRRNIHKTQPLVRLKSHGFGRQNSQQHSISKTRQLG